MDTFLAVSSDEFTGAAVSLQWLVVAEDYVAQRIEQSISVVGLLQSNYWFHGGARWWRSVHDVASHVLAMQTGPDLTGLIDGEVGSLPNSLFKVMS